jgi:hypothetical protein
MVQASEWLDAWVLLPLQAHVFCTGLNMHYKVA